jgi:hypothetical protein
LSNNEKVICHENEEIFIAFGDANIGCVTIIFTGIIYP